MKFTAGHCFKRVVKVTPHLHPPPHTLLYNVCDGEEKRVDMIYDNGNGTTSTSSSGFFQLLPATVQNEEQQGVGLRSFPDKFPFQPQTDSRWRTASNKTSHSFSHSFTSWSKWQAVRLDCLNPLRSNSSLVITLILNYVIKICNFYLSLKLFSTVLAIRWQRKQSDCVKINRFGVDDDLDLNKNIHFTFHRSMCGGKRCHLQIQPFKIDQQVYGRLLLFFLFIIIIVYF